MSKEQTKDLQKFLEFFGEEIIEMVLWLRNFASGLCPDANELIYDNYNAVAFWVVSYREGWPRHLFYRVRTFKQKCSFQSLLWQPTFRFPQSSSWAR
jgi:hypothetical protein